MYAIRSYYASRDRREVLAVRDAMPARLDRPGIRVGREREFAVSTKEFIGDNGKLTALKLVRVEFKDGKLHEIPGSEFELKADLVFLAMGFTQPLAKVLDSFGIEKDVRGNAKASTDGA